MIKYKRCNYCHRRNRQLASLAFIAFTSPWTMIKVIKGITNEDKKDEEPRLQSWQHYKLFSVNGFNIHRADLVTVNRFREVDKEK